MSPSSSKSFLGLAAVLLGLTALTSPSQAEVRPTRLRCEYLVNPSGVTATRPRLSWILDADGYAVVQSAYQVLVASDPTTLDGHHGDLWDSGKVPTEDSLHIAYAGQPLRSGQRVHWKVRAWDGDGLASAWSQPASWQMGLLEPDDWRAAWISHPAEVRATIPARNGYHSALTTNALAPHWVVLDLGQPRRIEAVRLFPARPFNWQPDTPGFLYPARFKVELSNLPDFSDAKLALDQTAAPLPDPGTNAPVYRCAPETARYVRLTVTESRPHAHNDFGFALAELEAFERGTNRALGARVMVSDSTESAGWSRHFLVDGHQRSSAGTRPEAQPVTMLRKEFRLSAPAKRATLYATALGVYALRLNAQPVGDHILAPEWTDYHTRVQYQAYDVTAQLCEGDNAIAALLGDGWYAGRLGMSDGLIQTLRGVYGSKPYLLAQIEIELTNGQRMRVVTDDSWQVSQAGPLRSSDLLDGEIYDARRELPGWDQPGYDTSGWLAAGTSSPRPAPTALPEPGALRPSATFPAVRLRLVSQPNEPIRAIAELKPIALSEPQTGVFVFDLGQNLVGRVRLELEAHAGATVTLRHAEMTNADGTVYVTNLRGAPQIDRYVARGQGREVYEPAFTQHGFRYVEVTGLRRAPQLESLTARAFNSAAPEVGGFECSDPMLNRLWTNILWTQRGNLLSVPTDCPQRDERLGWMGDIQAFSQTAIFNMDLAAFFTKWFQDIRDAQAKDGRYPDFAPHPYGPNERFSGVPAWGDAGTVVPWRAYVNYGDRDLLATHFVSAVRWVEFIRQANPDLLWRQNRGNDYNDWLNGDWIRQAGWPTQGAAVPNEVLATAFFAHSTDLVSRMARVLARDPEARRYADLFAAICAAFNRAYVSSDGRIRGDTQAGYALALHFNLLPEAQRPVAGRHLVEAVHRYRDRVATGIQTTHRMLLELSRAGHDELAWRLLTNHTFPSWGYMIANGATTIWERWDGYVQGRGFQDAGMNSFNHWALGSVGEWMIRHILGLNPDEEQPAYKHFRIRPRPGGGVHWARGHYDSIRGRIESDWRLAENRLILKVRIPANSTATVYVPADRVVVAPGDAVTAWPADAARFLRREDNCAVFTVGSGAYVFRGATRTP